MRRRDDLDGAGGVIICHERLSRRVIRWLIAGVNLVGRLQATEQPLAGFIVKSIALDEFAESLELFGFLFLLQQL